MGYNSCTVKRKPFISKMNQKKLFEFALKLVDMPEKFWYNVIFTDESKFKLFGSNSKQKVDLWQKN